MLVARTNSELFCPEQLVLDNAPSISSILLCSIWQVQDHKDTNESCSVGVAVRPHRSSYDINQLWGKRVAFAVVRVHTARQQSSLAATLLGIFDILLVVVPMHIPNAGVASDDFIQVPALYYESHNQPNLRQGVSVSSGYDCMLGAELLLR